MRFGTDIYIPLGMNCINFGDPLTFPVVAPVKVFTYSAKYLKKFLGWHKT